MGGVAAREFVRSHYNDDIAKLVTFGSPLYGSNLANNELSKYSPVSVFSVDLRSDAVRDLSPESIFLFGGNENSVSHHFYSNDVNNNGVLNDNIIGLNQDYSHLNEIARTWIVSKYSLSSTGDLVVQTRAQHLAIEDTIMTNRPHVSIDLPIIGTIWGETKDYYSLIRGLDEPDEKELAYVIGINSINKGFITYQKDNIPTDADLYKVVLTQDGKLTVKISANNLSGIDLFQILDEDLHSKELETNINTVIDYEAQAGTYYIRIFGTATNQSWQNPYTLETQFTATPIATMAVSPSNLQFYDAVIGVPKEKTIKLTNNGEANLLITIIGLSGADAGQFTVAPLPPFTITPGISQNVTVTFNPTSTGAKVASLEITTNRVDIPVKTISLEGNGVDHETRFLVCTPHSTYNYESTKVSTSKNKTFTILNTGSNTCTISDLALDGLNPAEYVITAPTVIPFDVGSGVTKQITIKFSPASIGVKNATLAITNNSDNISPIHSIELFGNGAENFYSGNNNYITACEYWFDEHFQSKTKIPVIQQHELWMNAVIPTDSLKHGLHSFHIRYLDKKGQWSAIASEFFHKLPVTSDSSKTITAREYWFDDDFTNKVSTEITPGQTITTNEGFDVSKLQTGLHSYHIRYKDNAGQWSSVVSEFFHKLPSLPAGDRLITACEYWFDDDFASKISDEIAPGQTITTNSGFDVNSLTNGLHSYHVRYKDNAGQWSSVVSEFFHKLPVSYAQDNLISAYRYWFNREEKNIQLIILATPVNPYELIRDISVSGLTSGDNTIHFQFKDTRQAWSSVVTDVFEKTGIVGLFDRTIEKQEIKCYPNPFNEEVTIILNLVNDFDVFVEVQNQLGQSVKNIASGKRVSMGMNQFKWDGTNKNNIKVTPGVYFIKVTINGIVNYRKVIFLW